MRCPKCTSIEDKVIDSRISKEGSTIRRRRECLGCGHRFTTYEEVEHQGLMVLKRDGRHEEFSKEKLLVGVRKACQKRPISPKVMEDLVEKIMDEIKRTLAANNMRDGVHIRLTLTRGVKVTSGMDPRLNQSGPTLIVLAEHKAPVYTKTGLSLITSKIRRPPADVLDARIHHANLLNSILAKIEANNAGADDALMLDTRGFVAETNATHVFIVRNSDESRASGDLATGRVVACPEGITRATVIEICAAEKIRCVEADLSLVDVYGAHEIFCTGTMGELAGVVRIDNRQIGDGRIGPMTKRLSDLYAKRTATEGVQVVDL